jgi:hypothetical protein
MKKRKFTDILFLKLTAIVASRITTIAATIPEKKQQTRRLYIPEIDELKLTRTNSRHRSSF